MFGKYAPFIIPAYSLTVAALAIAAIWIGTTYRSRLRELQQLEEAGLKRRSEAAKK